MLTLGLVDSFENIFNNFTPVHVGEKRVHGGQQLAVPLPPREPGAETTCCLQTFCSCVSHLGSCYGPSAAAAAAAS